jgi:adhesin transport system outer membrane protein
MNHHKLTPESPLTISSKLGLSTLAWAHVILLTGYCATSVAQTGAVDRTEDLRSTRERTRQAIEAVRAEQPGALDDARGLGAHLDTNQTRDRTNLWQNRVQVQQPSQAPVSTPEGLRYLENIQWPEPRHTGQRKVLPRPSSPGSENTGRLAYTPDFSRQRLTMGFMAGRVLIDLPQQELTDLNPKQDFARVDVNPSDALGLPDLVNVGISYSPVMDQALAQLDTAINRRKQARSDMFPRVSVRQSQGSETSKGANVQPDGSNRHTTYSESLRLTQPIFNLPVISDWMAELSNEAAANWRMHAARESVALAVTQATLNLASTRLVLEHSDEQLINFSRLFEYVQTRAQTGAASTADLERTRGRVLLARQIRIEQQANYKNALLEVQRLTGQTPTALRLPFLNQLPGLPTTHAEMRRMVWTQSYDLRALRNDIEAQRRTLASNQQRLLPVVGLSLERDASRNVRGENARQIDQRVMGIVSWDFSLGGREIYGASAAASELSNRESKLTEQGERLMQQVAADFAALQSTTLRVAAGQAEQLASSTVVSSVNEQLRIGRIGSLLEALDAYERHFAARQRLTQTLSQQMQSQAQLLARMGLLSDLQHTASAELEPASTSTSSRKTSDEPAAVKTLLEPASRTETTKRVDVAEPNAAPRSNVEPPSSANLAVPQK